MSFEDPSHSHSCHAKVSTLLGGRISVFYGKNETSPSPISWWIHLSVVTANAVSHLSLLEHVIKEPFCIHSSPQLKFPSLEVLSLDDNHLSDPSVFVSLSHLRCLKELNLDRNRISAVPYLRQAESRHFFLMEVPGELEAEKGQIECVMLQNEGDPDRMGEQSLPVPACTEPGGFSGKGLSYARQTLNYFTLQIADEAALLPVAFFPSLKELTFHNNPLTTTRSGQPPLLTWLLQHNLGIKLVRQKSPATERWHVSIPLKASRKVRRDGHRDHRGETLTAGLRVAQEELVGHMDPSRVGGKGGRGWRYSVQDEVGESDHLLSLLFSRLPQPSSLSLAPEQSCSSPRSSSGASSGLSPTAAEAAKAFVVPFSLWFTGIQKNVQALYQVLNHPLVYRDARARLDCVQKPFVPRRKHVRMPGPPARKTKAEILEGILVAMRNTLTFTEVPLGMFLRSQYLFLMVPQWQEKDGNTKVSLSPRVWQRWEWRVPPCPCTRTRLNALSPP
uniref:X-ray radiation resistance associated 1 n=1 Tax=Strigops habroptila TaxID=2489341 RepID=A0A672U1H2_STRHB